MTGGGSTPATLVWWEALRADPVPWLLEGSGPGLAWRVLAEVVGRPRESPAVVRERGGANAAEPVASLLARLQPDGTWAGSTGLWTAGGDGWRLVAAVQLGADPTDPRLQAACERLLEETPGEGGFAAQAGEKVTPCLTARVLLALLFLGWERHLRVQEAMAWFEEAGEGNGWSCGIAGHAAGSGGCTVAAAALLAASAEMPPGRRESLAGRASDVVLGVLDQWGLPEWQGWSRLGHPNLDRTDLAEVLWALATAGVGFDQRMADGLRALQEAQDGLGRWMRSVPAPFISGADTAVGHPSRWITLKAVRALREYAAEAGLPRLFPQPPR